MKLSKEFFNRNAEVVAKELLGKILVFNKKKGKIVETEAYFDEKDPASRACKNGDLKETMKMEAGTILVYGIHDQWMFNIVTNRKGKAEAVLIRALEPLNFRERTNGPGLLTKAMNINKSLHRKKAFSREIFVEDSSNKFEIVTSKRIGVKKDLDRNLRFCVKESKFVSRI